MFLKTHAILLPQLKVDIKWRKKRRGLRFRMVDY